MQFETREQYLAAVTMWKEQYTEHSNKIRAIKNQIKEESRKKGYTYAWPDLISAKKKATTMIAERQAAKVEAQRQYLLTRQN